MYRSRSRAFLPFLAALLLLLMACNLPLRPRTARGPDATITAAIQTVQVQLTLTAAGSTAQPAATTQAAPTVAAASLTPNPPTATVYVPTAVPPTAVTRCNWAQFVSDVSIPDGTKLSPGQTFTKTWRLKNIGTCTWNSDYTLAFENGEPMGAPATVSIGETVPPGDTIDLSINLTAPATPGKKTGNFKLRNPAGIPFGLGWDAQQSFYVLIEVVGPTATPTATKTPGPKVMAYDFTANFCAAEWRSAAGVLPCPGEITHEDGFVMKIDNPVLENGEAKTTPGLWTHPEWIASGVISGKYPAFNVQSGDRFQATIACLEESTPCSVTFQLNYRVSGGPLKNLGQWNQTFDGAVQNLDIDLTPLAGKSVEFVLAVLAGDTADTDWAFWWQPKLMR